MSAGVRIEVPATSANLGPGFDSLGLALDLVDDVAVSFWDGPDVVDIAGYGEVDLPRDGRHLIIRVTRETLAALSQAGRGTFPADAGLTMQCTNRIPHARGLGSSAAAYAAGILAGFALAGLSTDAAELVAMATRYEGHPDNVAPALLGGFTVAWMSAGAGRAVTIAPNPALRAVAVIPGDSLETRTARAALPAQVPYADAVFSLSRSALLVHAVTSDPSQLFEATEDVLHQGYRREVYPASMTMVDSLRAQGFSAFISGAGPAVLTLCDEASAAAALAATRAVATRVAPGSDVRRLAMSGGARIL